MHAPDTYALLDLWDRGHALSRESWALELLDAAQGAGTHALAQWPVGRRDRALLRLRGVLFGRTLNGLAPCPQCHEQAEFTASVDELGADHDDHDDHDDHHDHDGSHTGNASPLEEHWLHADGFSVRFRVVTAGDLQAVECCRDAESAARRLMTRCVLVAHYDGRALEAADLPSVLVEELGARIEAADPVSDVELGMRCPACGHEWRVNFDIVSFLWSEIGVWARRMLREVHELASVYGWSEVQILSLSAARRRFYLGQISS